MYNFHSAFNVFFITFRIIQYKDLVHLFSLSVIFSSSFMFLYKIRSFKFYSRMNDCFESSLGRDVLNHNANVLTRSTSRIAAINAASCRLRRYRAWISAFWFADSIKRNSACVSLIPSSRLYHLRSWKAAGTAGSFSCLFTSYFYRVISFSSILLILKELHGKIDHCVSLAIRWDSMASRRFFLQ